MDSDATRLHSAFQTHRGLLWGICYRMLGCAADADDVVQDAFEKALKHPPEDASRPLRPWLVRVTMNTARDHLRRRRRRPYEGPWLPGPVETDSLPALAAADAEARYGELESVSVAFLTALEHLSPGQRSVLLLRDVLGYSVRETAESLEIGEANVKTTLHRARARMAAYDSERVELNAAQLQRHGAALRALLFHLSTHNVAALQQLFTGDPRALNDGAGDFFAARSEIRGLHLVVRFHLNVQRFHLRRQRAMPRFALRSLNGEPAAVVDWPTHDPGQPQRIVMRIRLDAEGRVQQLDTVVARRKLHGVDFDALPPLLSAQTARELLATTRVGAQQPPPATWLRGAAGRARAAGIGGLRRLGRRARGLLRRRR